MKVKYEGASYTYRGELEFAVVFEDPCESTATVTATTQVNPPDYYYETPSASSVSWAISPPF